MIVLEMFVKIYISCYLSMLFFICVIYILDVGNPSLNDRPGNVCKDLSLVIYLYCSLYVFSIS